MKVSTSQKLDWLDAVMADERLDARAKVVAYGIAMHLNRARGNAFVSDRTLADKTGCRSVRTVQDGRSDLRALGWVDWKRTGSANVYSLLEGQKEAVVERQKMLRGARETARRDRQNVADLDAQTSADLERANRQTTAELDRQDAAEHDRQTSADIPVSFNPVVLTPLKKEKSLTKVSMPAEFDIWWSIYPRRVRKVPSAENLHARHRNPTSHYLRTTVRRGALCCRTAKPRSAVHQASCNLAEPRMLAGQIPSTRPRKPENHLPRRFRDRRHARIFGGSQYMNEVVKFSERLPTVRKEEQTFRDARNLLARFQRAQQESFRSEKPYEECLLAVIDEIIPASENVLAQFTELNRGATKREIANHLALLVKCFHGGKDSSAEVFGRMLCEDVAAQQPSIGALEAACRALRRTSRFIPTISEVLEAVETAETSQRKTCQSLASFPRIRERIEQQIASDRQLRLNWERENREHEERKAFDIRVDPESDSPL